jgi:D-sedoheptulose 7-phosphate isomerase
MLKGKSLWLNTCAEEEILMTEALIDSYLVELAEVVARLPRDAIRDVVDELQSARERRAHIFILGNGGSAATASHMANDLNKLTIVPGQPRFRAIALSDNVPCMTAWANDCAYADIFAEQLLNFLDPGDVVIAISASGNSANVLKAVQLAHEVQATAIGFTGQDGGQLKDLVDICVSVPSDHMGMQEDCHMILDHVIANVLRLQALEQGATMVVGTGLVVDAETEMAVGE